MPRSLTRQKHYFAQFPSSGPGEDEARGRKGESLGRAELCAAVPGGPTYGWLGGLWALVSGPSHLPGDADHEGGEPRGRDVEMAVEEVCDANEGAAERRH